MDRLHNWERGECAGSRAKRIYRSEPMALDTHGVVLFGRAAHVGLILSFGEAFGVHILDFHTVAHRVGLEHGGDDGTVGALVSAGDAPRVGFHGCSKDLGSFHGVVCCCCWTERE